MKKVVKFGGTSLANAEQIRKVVEIIKADEGRKYVVVSAPGKRNSKDDKITDLLYKTHAMAEKGMDYYQTWQTIKDRYNEIIKELGIDLDLSEEYRTIETALNDGVDKDFAASRGEHLNGIIIAKYLGYKYMEPADFILFDDNKNCRQKETIENIAKAFADVEKAVIPGFYGANKNGDIVTFSRGGSDITGSFVAAGVGADEYENWTDVSGVMVTDPRIIPEAESIDTITYTELRELSYMGASVLHADAIFPVMKSRIPIHILNTNRPEDKGTYIVEATTKKAPYTITGIAGRKGFAGITINKLMMNNEIGLYAKLAMAFADNGISIEHMPSGIDTMSVIAAQKDIEEKEQKLMTEIHKAVKPDEIIIETNLALIAVVGRCMKDTHGVSGRIFSSLAYAGVNVRMIDQGSSELNIIIGVKEDDYEKAIRAIYDMFVKQ